MIIIVFPGRVCLYEVVVVSVVVQCPVSSNGWSWPLAVAFAIVVAIDWQIIIFCVF